MYLKEKHRDQNTEEFCTARGTQNGWRIAFSFFGSAVGSWCITAPPSFAV
jgi:SSS family solute:Na+ symporter